MIDIIGLIYVHLATIFNTYIAQKEDESYLYNIDSSSYIFINNFLNP